jgi:2-keto-3-deoxy-L-rhamnonate aldolase RhmA
MGLSELVPQEHVVFSEFDAGEGILVDLNTKKYFQLNETAIIVWRGLENNLPLEEIVAQITDAYEVSTEHANESVRKLIESLRALKLLRPR